MLAFFVESCAFKSVVRTKNIPYLKKDSDAGVNGEKLNVFAPLKKGRLKEVLIFIHGGNWNSGNKKLYNYLGNRMARKGIVTVIIDYPLSPKAGYNEMAADAALAVKWVRDNITLYGGDPGKIYLSGHSAGGHLAALVSIKNKYFDSLKIPNPIKGAILIDAAGLDMYNYLANEGLESGNTYLQTFTNDPKVWKEASPIYFLHPGMPSMLIYVGGKTYPSIKEGNERFIHALKTFIPDPEYHIMKGKKHIPMILQFFNTHNSRYKEILQFMQNNK